jgi:uncharacterized protein YcaQ
MNMITLTPSQARQIMLAHQGLWPPRSWHGKEGILEFINRVGCIQYDPLNMVGQNPELVLQSRVKDYQPQLLNELLYTERRLLDGFDKVMSIYQVDDWPYFQRFRDADRVSTEQRSDGLQMVLSLVRAEIEKRGPLCSLDLDINHRVDWPWGPTRAARAALESLYFAGELIIHHKVNTRKYYDLANRHISVEILQAPDPNQSEVEYQDWHVLRRIGSVGLLWNRSSEAWLGLRGVKSPERIQTIKRLVSDGCLCEARIEGIGPSFYLRRQDLSLLEQTIEIPPPVTCASFLAPLDNLLWERRQLKALFDFDYRWEVYTPVVMRKYGYYVLPVLYGDHFIARIEPVLEKHTRNLVIKNWWWESDVIPDDEMQFALVDCFDDFIKYLNAKSIQVNGSRLEPEETEKMVNLLMRR